MSLLTAKAGLNLGRSRQRPPFPLLGNFLPAPGIFCFPKGALKNVTLGITTQILSPFFFSFFFFFFCRARSVQKFWGQGLNPHPSSDNARSLTCCTSREHPQGVS